jgi:hypothetical protein
MFLKIIFTSVFITSTVSGNRFPLSVLSYPPVSVKNVTACDFDGDRRVG